MNDGADDTDFILVAGVVVVDVDDWIKAKLNNALVGKYKYKYSQAKVKQGLLSRSSFVGGGFSLALPRS